MGPQEHRGSCEATGWEKGMGEEMGEVSMGLKELDEWVYAVAMQLVH
jgi:hypothetical protein